MARTPENFRAFTRVVVAFCLVIMAVLIALEAIPLHSDDAAYINQAGLQRTRTEVLANSMFILEYSPQSEHTQAMALIETTLPLFKQEQATLQSNSSPDIQLLIQQSRSDYLAITSATDIVISESEQNVDPVQAAIVISRRDSYRSTINQIVTLLVTHAEASTQALFYIKLVLLALLIVISLVYWLIVERRVWQHIAQTKEANT